MSTKAKPVDSKQAGEMRADERGEFRRLAFDVSESDTLKKEREAVERLEKWVDAFGRDRFNAGIEWERERAEPARTAAIEDEANSYVLDNEQKEQFANVLSVAINLAKGGYTPHAQIDVLTMRHEVDAAILAKRAFKAGYRRGVNAVYDDAESGIDRKVFAVCCPGCRYVNPYPGGFAPVRCGKCGEDLSKQPLYREVSRVEDVPVFEPIARASHHDYNFNGGTGEYALIKLYCQPHQAEKVYAAALELVERKGEAISGPWYGPGVAKERSADLFGASEPAATCRQCGCTDLNCSRCVERTGEPCHWVEPDLCSACAAENRNREHEHKEELNAAYSDGYRTGKMHAGPAASFMRGNDPDAFIEGMKGIAREAREEAEFRPASFVNVDFTATDEEPDEEPESETPLVYVTVSRKGKITASGPAPAVLEVLRGVLELEDEEPAAGETESESERT